MRSRHDSGEWELGDLLGRGLCGEVRVGIKKREEGEREPKEKVFSHANHSFFFFLSIATIHSLSLLCLISLIPLFLQFALKIIDFPALVDSFCEIKITADTLEANLMREIEVMKRLRHRNIVRLEDSFWVNTELYMCMELIEGKNLLRTIPQGGMKEEEAKGLFFQLCSAVAYCHTNNVSYFFPFFRLRWLTEKIQVIHGDLKPDNILIRERDKRLKLIDFGFSHIVKPGEQLEVTRKHLSFSFIFLL